MTAARPPVCPTCGTLIPESEWPSGQWECPNSRCGRLLNPAEVVT